MAVSDSRSGEQRRRIELRRLGWGGLGGWLPAVDAAARWETCRSSGWRPDASATVQRSVLASGLVVSMRSRPGWTTFPRVVQAGTWRVVDGARRLAAARAVDRTMVEVEVVEVGDDELLAERARRNSGTGALTRSERRAVALELLVQHPHWSDRRIGGCVGVAGTTIGRLREHPGAALLHLHTGVRIGADGRRYSRDTTVAKAQAVLLHTQEPHRSLNSLAREVGLSPATVKRALGTHTIGNGDASPGVEPERADRKATAVADTLAATSPTSRRERWWWGRRLLAALARLLTRRVARRQGPTRRPD